MNTKWIVVISLVLMIVMLITLFSNRNDIFRVHKKSKGCLTILHNLDRRVNRISFIKICIPFLIILFLFSSLYIPVIQTTKKLNFEKEPRKASAETVSVNVLHEMIASGGNVNRTTDGPTSFDLRMDSLGVLEVDLLSPTLKTQFQANEFIGNIVNGGFATVTLNILPITEENLPSLYSAVDGLTGSVTGLTNQVGTLTAELTNISPGILQVDGLTKVTDALTALNNLEASLDSLTAYEQNVPVIVNNNNGILTVEYADGLGQHLEDAINDVVIELLKDLSVALEGLNITLVDGGINTGNIIQLVEELENLPLLGEVLSPLLGEGILGQILNVLGGLLGPILDPILRPLLGKAVEQVVEILEDLINELLATSGSLAVEITILADNLANGLLNITDALASLQLIGGVNILLNNAQVEEEVSGIVDVRVLTVDEPVIDVNIFVDQGIITQIDFGEYVEPILAFDHVPDNITFDTTEIVSGFQRIPIYSADGVLSVIDTRGEGSTFQIQAQSEPLFNEKYNHTLSNVIKYRDERGVIHDLFEAQEIYSGTTGEDQITEIRWNENQGPFIEVDPTNAYEGIYNSTITWTLVDGP